MIRRLDQAAADFDEKLTDLLAFAEDDQRQVQDVVARIIADIRAGGDEALLALTNRFDQRSVVQVSELILTKQRLRQAFEAISEDIRAALIEAADRVRIYHEKQRQALGQGWEYVDEAGNRLGQKVQPMDRVGIYAPGGKAAYPSTIIMTAVPARAAGVKEIVLCVPTPRGEVSETLLAAAHIAGVDHVFTVGGAQAVAAMAYGTESIPAVDKIVGPGNIYVATAKQQVFGQVGIDMIAGPSEVVIIADRSADPEWLILDLFAQAEHDELAQAILISAEAELLQQVRDLLPALLDAQPRKAIISAALAGRGALIQVADLDAAIAVANRIAPEHLQLALENPDGYLDRIRHAGAVFLGVNTAEVVGDYTAGPSHVLPTSGTARFSSPLGIYDFQTRTSIIGCSPAGSVALNRGAALLAREEGLMAHAASALARLDGQED